MVEDHEPDVAGRYQQSLCWPGPAFRLHRAPVATLGPSEQGPSRCHRGADTRTARKGPPLRLLQSNFIRSWHQAWAKQFCAARGISGKGGDALSRQNLTRAVLNPGTRYNT